MAQPCIQEKRVQELEKSDALSNQALQYMQKDITEIKEAVKQNAIDFNKKFDAVVDMFKGDYVTKSEFDIVKKRLNSMRGFWTKILGGVVTALIISLIAFFIKK